MRRISRTAAVKKGLRRYFDGKPCPQGHLSPKLVVNYTCIRCLHEKYAATRRKKRAAARLEKEKLRKLANNNHALPQTKREARISGLKHYYTGIPCKRGHITKRFLSGNCVLCQKELAPIVDMRIRNRMGDAAYRAKRAEQARKRRQAAPDIANTRYRERRKTDIQFRLASLLRSRIKHALKDHNKSKSAVEYLGGSVEETKRHIAAQFQEGMLWENHGSKTWHIDHIIPICSFDLTIETERYRAFNYKNLQPLWATDNLRKTRRLPKPTK